MSTGSSKADLLKIYVVTPHDKNKSHLSSTDKSAFIKIPKKQDNPKIAKVTQYIEKVMQFLKTPRNNATKPHNESSSDSEDKSITSKKTQDPNMIDMMLLVIF